MIQLKQANIQLLERLAVVTQQHQEALQDASIQRQVCNLLSCLVCTLHHTS